MIALVAAALLVSSCSADDRTGPATTATLDPEARQQEAESTVGGLDEPDELPSPVRLGAGVLVDERFERLDGRRVGVILNQASVVDGELLLDLLAAAPSVELVAAFAPEHGLRAEAAAGELVADEVDEATGVPVHSLYGENRSPRPEELAGLDVLVFDLQDVGSRTYTYISTMGLAMQAAADAGITFMVLDRPNPLGGTYVAGYERQPELDSFIGQYPVPSAHGMTTGELALAIQGEGWLDGLDQLDLEVAAMEGWHRTDRWADTGLPWHAPSPALPTVAATDAYPGTVLFEATTMSVGRGSAEPFTVVGAPWVDAEAVVAELRAPGRASSLPGVTFEPLVFTPHAAPGADAPPFADEAVPGVRVVVTDPAEFDPVATGVHLMEVMGADAIDRPEVFDLLAGTDRLRLGLVSGAPADDLVAGWAEDVAGFEQRRQPYLLYD